MRREREEGDKKGKAENRFDTAHRKRRREGGPACPLRQWASFQKGKSRMEMIIISGERMRADGKEKEENVRGMMVTDKTGRHKMVKRDEGKWSDLAASRSRE